ncbi:MAG: ABC transporter ATP-binding protein [Spirochaetia bacterium]|jgi:simple sugar transport system ATP-binding protein|nr:ABC transporter ATP-binding protein [Spirochaetia bacterium]
MEQSNLPALVSMRGISKTFPGVQANDCVDLELRPGEVLALLGENGAGKSTLMNILCGLYRPDAGEIEIRGRSVSIEGPRVSQSLGIGMVHQNFKLVDSMTVLENIILGMKNQPLVLDMKKVRAELLQLSERYNLKVEPDASIWQLSVGEQQRVEILKLLYRKAEILILDEPTAVLTPQESAELAKVIRLMKSEGKSAIFITHKMEEVMNFSDRVMVLRKGKVVAGLPTGSTSPSELARLMVGREMLFSMEKKPFSPGRTILKLEKVNAKDDRGLSSLNDLDLEIRSGEILGIAGVAGNGQKELAEVITGLRTIESGSLRLEERDMSRSSPFAMIKAGVAHIPQDRASVGSVGDLSVASNLAMKEYRKPPLSKGIFLIPQRITAWAKKLIERFKIMTPGPDTPVKFLSGGNIQKTILAREIGACRTLLVAVYPSRGLDIGATESVRRQLVDQRDQGLGVLFVSEDIDELIQVADTIAVLFEGRIMAVMSSKEAEPERLGLLMAGVGA